MSNYGLLNPNSNPLVLQMLLRIEKAVQKLNNFEAVECDQINFFMDVMHTLLFFVALKTLYNAMLASGVVPISLAIIM